MDTAVEATEGDKKRKRETKDKKKKTRTLAYNNNHHNHTASRADGTASQWEDEHDYCCDMTPNKGRVLTHHSTRCLQR